jgi:hypothetical protein
MALKSPQTIQTPSRSKMGGPLLPTAMNRTHASTTSSVTIQPSTDKGAHERLVSTAIKAKTLVAAMRASADK